MKPIIRVENLGKQYRIGQHTAPYATVRESLVGAARAPFDRLRRGFRREVNGDAASGRFWALKDVSFDVKPGEVVGIIGRNGAGKSTLLKILSRVTEPTAGRVDLYGRVGSLLEVGTGFHQELTGRENIYLSGSILGMRKAEIIRKFDEILEFAEIESFLDTPVKRYSSGMYVRLAFAVAAHLDPEILMIDEVLAVGDAAFQKKCLGKMQEVAGHGRTVLFVSHNLTTVNSLCQRAAWMVAGRLHRDGPASEVVEAYLSSSMTKTDGYHDLRSIARTYTVSSPLRLVGLVFNNGGPVRHNAPLRMDIDYETSGAAEAAAFGVGFASPAGGRVLSCDTDIPGERYTILGKGSGHVTLVIPILQLQPGNYFLDVGCRSGDNRALDYLPSFSQVEVLPGPSTPSVIIGRREAGSVRVPPAEIRHVFKPSGLARPVSLTEAKA